MSTRSTISILKEDGSVLSAYCHSDGYISYNGAMLFLHYQKKGKVNELLSFGEMSSLNKEVNPTTKEHDCDNRENNVTVFYGRDRGEDSTEATKYESFKDFIKNGNFQEYDYVFNEEKEKWYLLDVKNKKLKVLGTLVEKEKDNLNGDLKEDYCIYFAKKAHDKLKKELKNKGSNGVKIKV